MSSLNFASPYFKVCDTISSSSNSYCCCYSHSSSDGGGCSRDLFKNFEAETNDILVIAWTRSGTARQCPQYCRHMTSRICIGLSKFLILVFGLYIEFCSKLYKS